MAQDAVHFFEDCDKTAHIRELVDSILCEEVKTYGGELGFPWWEALERVVRRDYMMSWECNFPMDLEGDA